MTLGQLRTLIHVAELGSLNKAADRLRIAQPALSRHIRQLEQELGVALFRRHGHGMVITDAGSRVLARAASVMRELSELRAEAELEGSQPSGRVAIGMPPTVAEILTVPLAQTITASHPRLTIRFATAFTGYLLEWLQRGDIEVAVLYDPQPLRSLRTQPLLVEDLVAVGNAARGFSPTQAVPFRELARGPLLLPSGRHGLRALVEKTAHDLGVPLEVSIEADSLGTLKELVLEGMGTTILPLVTVHQEIGAKRLSAAPIIEPALSRRMVMASSRDRSMSRAALTLSHMLVEVVGELVRNGKWAARLVGDGQSP
jgi:DNA-binding transcriptional LysR family regulator